MSEVAAPANAEEVTTGTLTDPAAAVSETPQENPASPVTASAEGGTSQPSTETAAPSTPVAEEAPARTLDQMYDDYMAGKPDQPRAEVDQVQTYLRQQEERLNSHEQTAQAFPAAYSAMRRDIIAEFGEDSPESMRLGQKLGQHLEALRAKGEDIYLKPFIQELYKYAQEEGVPRRILDYADPVQLGKVLIEHGRGSPKDAVSKAEVTKQVKAAREEGAKATRDLVSKIDPNFKWPEDGTGGGVEGAPAASVVSDLPGFEAKLARGEQLTEQEFNRYMSLRAGAGLAIR